MKKKSSIIIILAIVLIGGLYYFTIGRNDSSKQEKLPKDTIIVGEVDEGITGEENIQEIAVGKEAPNFTLKNLNGEEVSLEDYRGKIVLINFWATWCKYCDLEMPDLQKLNKENDDLVVLAVDVMEDKKLVEEYIEKGGYDFEVVLDEDGDIAETYLVSSFPTSYFVDKNGILLGGVPGMMTYADINQLLDGIRESE